ncbi:hypothetical protein LN042_11925 [Kitasatospora sp. RB6PN24]|uniref:hypothetical protein n=1 Tax=Kitasatospora humi TaxID=2893891 RepID=UPI001E601577|nr:hypothetical protein [Kitasatospora humi]MCC9307793.1 hypothetical protein [Kitasatospora humi]
MLAKLSSWVAARWSKGLRLVAGGWALRLAGTALGVPGFYIARSGLDADQWSGVVHLVWWLRELGGVAAFMVGLRAFRIGRRLVVRGRQCAAAVIDSFDALAGTVYVLYLRPFSNDADMAALNSDFPGGTSLASLGMLFLLSGKTQEEQLVRRFGRFGRVIAVGRPDELLPPVGAVRGQLPLDDWQGTVSSLIDGAHVVLMSAGPGPGTVWEFTEAVRRLPPTRLVLLIYCDAATYERFREAVAVEYERRLRAEPQAPRSGCPPLPALPDYPPLARGPYRPRYETWLGWGRLRWDFVLKGVVVFDQDWTATFTRFDPTARRWLPGLVIRRELRPVLEKLDVLEPRN